MTQTYWSSEGELRERGVLPDGTRVVSGNRGVNHGSMYDEPGDPYEDDGETEGQADGPFSGFGITVIVIALVWVLYLTTNFVHVWPKG